MQNNFIKLIINFFTNFLSLNGGLLFKNFKANFFKNLFSVKFKKAKILFKNNDLPLFNDLLLFKIEINIKFSKRILIHSQNSKDFRNK